MLGFNFRSFPSYTTDDLGQVAVNHNTAYPTTSEGVTYGWTVTGAPLFGANRNATVDPRLAGLVGIDNNDGVRLFATDSGSGFFSVTLALGDYNANITNQFVRIVEVDSSQVVQSVLATLTNVEVPGNQWADATGTIRTSPADWINNNEPLVVEVSTGNNLAIEIGDPSLNGVRNTTISHFYFEATTAPKEITDVDGDEVVEDGQQDIPFTVANFDNDVTTASITSGVYSAPLTGLTVTGTSYTVDLFDVSSFASDTAGIPFTTANHVNLFEASDGTDAATLEITRNPKTGWAVVDTVGAVATQGSVFENRVGGAMSDNSQVLYPTASNTTIAPNGTITTDAATVEGKAWDVDTGTWELFTVNFASVEPPEPVGDRYPEIVTTRNIKYIPPNRRVWLDAGKTTRGIPVGDLKVQWTQTSGTPVVLERSDSLHPSFVSPDQGKEVLVFELSVTNYQGATSTASVRAEIDDDDYVQD